MADRFIGRHAGGVRLELPRHVELFFEPIRVAKQRHHVALEESLELVLRKAQRTTLSVRTLLNLFRGRGGPLLLIFLSLPFCQPLQLPGFSTPFGLIIVFIGFRVAYGQKIWLPDRILARKLPGSWVRKCVNTSLFIVRKIQKVIRPRYIFLAQHPVMKLTNGILITLFGLVFTLPIPIPLINLFAAWPLLFLGLGLLEDDGVMIGIGYLIPLLVLAGAALFWYFV